MGEINVSIQSSILPIARSDHFLVRVDFFEPCKLVRNPFKCEKIWFLDPNFLECFKIWWSQSNFKGSKMFIFVSKMKILKENTLRWNKEHFNNIFKEKIEIEEKLKELNLEVIKKRMNNDSYVLEKELLAK